MPLPYFLVLPSSSGWVSSPCLGRLGVEEQTYCLDSDSMSCPSKRKNGANLSLCNNQFCTWQPCLIQTAGDILTPGATHKESSLLDAAQEKLLKEWDTPS